MIGFYSFSRLSPKPKFSTFSRPCQKKAIIPDLFQAFIGSGFFFFQIPDFFFLKWQNRLHLALLLSKKFSCRRASVFESEVWYSSDLNTAILDRRSLCVFESRFSKSFFFFVLFSEKNRVVVRSILLQNSKSVLRKNSRYSEFA